MADEAPKLLKKRPGDLFALATIGRKQGLFDDVYHDILKLSWTGYFGLIGVAFVLANAVFAGLYALQPGCITGADGVGGYFFFSVQTLATIGYGVMAPMTAYAHVLVAIEALAGLLGFALITGVTFARFSRPKARILFSQKIAIGTRNGERFAMFRVANERHNQIVEATLRIIVLQDIVTAEGEPLRNPLDLVLVRDRSAFFRLTWTAVHKIDEKSPFFGDNVLEEMRKKRTEIYCNLQGLDETLAQTVHARHAYALEDIAWNARFKDVISVQPDGTRVIDYRHFHDVIELSEGDASSKRARGKA